MHFLVNLVLYFGRMSMWSYVTHFSPQVQCEWRPISRGLRSISCVLLTVALWINGLRLPLFLPSKSNGLRNGGKISAERIWKIIQISGKLWFNQIECFAAQMVNHPFINLAIASYARVSHRFLCSFNCPCGAGSVLKNFKFRKHIADWCMMHPVEMPKHENRRAVQSFHVFNPNEDTLNKNWDFIKKCGWEKKDKL